ncbi:MAG: ATP-binding protein [Pseudomonadota bacterium]
MAKSLGQFIAQNKVTLDNCASEALHLSGAVQNRGALIGLDAATHQIVAASENVDSMLGCPPHDMLLGEAFATQFKPLADELQTADLGEPLVHTLLGESYPGANQTFDVACHELGGIIYVEFMPSANTTDHDIRSKMRFAQQACSRIIKAPTFQEGADIAVDAMRKLTGFPKSMVYQFMPDWSGHVIAESRDERMSSYLDLFFPAHDIPAQARHLYSLVSSRSVSSSDDDNSRIAVAPDVEPLDLTYSLLRSVSPMHTAYFRNMGLQSSFSVGLRYQESLWGLIVCHNDEAGFLPIDIRRLGEDVASALMTRLAQAESERRADKIVVLRRIEANFASELRESGDVGKSLVKFAPDLRRFMDADGFAAEYDGEIITDGAVPPNEFIHDILQLGIDLGARGHFMDAALPQTMQTALDQRETACGILLLPVKLERNCLLAWFRGPMQKLAKWAGDPNQKEIMPQIDGTHRLNPRNSFKTWTDEHLNIALPWLKSEIEVAKSLFQEILDLIAYQAAAIRKLSDRNATLTSFTHSTVHDIRGPLRTINLALSELRESENRNADSQAFREAIATAAETSVDRLDSLVDQVLAYVEIGHSEPAIDEIPLADIVADVEQMLADEIRSDAAILRGGNTGVVRANRALLTTAIQNLVSNAIRYRHSERTPTISIEQVDSADRTRIFVTDNGIGIDPEHADQIFQPFKRLHRRDEIEGSGIGLASVQRVAELHGGRIYLDTDYDRTHGSRFVLELPREAPN